MKKITKTIAAITLLLLLTAALFSIVSFADEPEAISEEESSVETEADPPEDSVSNENSGIGFFEAIYETVLDNSDNIFSLLAFAGTLIIALVYKKGLLPTVTNAARMISDSLKKMNEENEKCVRQTEGQGELITACTEGLSRLTEEFKRLSNEIESDSISNERKMIGTLLDTQIELLRDVFLSSSLPHHQKEAVQAKVTEMKEALNKNGKEQ